jgi:hypothetical protein
MLVHGNLRDLRRETLKLIDFRSHYMLHDELKNYVLEEAKDFSKEELEYDGPKGHFIEQLKVLIRINEGVDKCVKFFRNHPPESWRDKEHLKKYPFFMKIYDALDFLLKRCIDDNDQLIPDIDIDGNIEEQIRHHEHKRKMGHFSTGLGSDIVSMIFKHYIRDNAEYIVPMSLIGTNSSRSLVGYSGETTVKFYSKISHFNEVNELIKGTTIIDETCVPEPRDYSIDLSTATPLPKEKQLTIQQVFLLRKQDAFTHEEYYKKSFETKGRYPIDLDSLVQMSRADNNKCPHQARWIAELARIRCSIFKGTTVPENEEEIRKQADVVQSKLSDFDWLSSPFTSIITYCLFPEMSTFGNENTAIRFMQLLYEFSTKAPPNCGLPINTVIVNNKKVVKKIRRHFDKQRDKFLFDMIKTSNLETLEQIRHTPEYENKMFEINEREEAFIKFHEEKYKKTVQGVEGKQLFVSDNDRSSTIYTYPGLWFDINLYHLKKPFDVFENQELKRMIQKFNENLSGKKTCRRFNFMLYSLSNIDTDIVNTTSFMNFRMLFNPIMIAGIVGNMRSHLKVSWSNVKLSDVMGRWWLPEKCMQETIPEFALPLSVEVIIIRDLESKMEFEKTSFETYKTIPLLEKVVSFNNKMPILRNMDKYLCKHPLSEKDFYKYFIEEQLDELLGMDSYYQVIYAARMDRRKIDSRSVMDRKRYGSNTCKKYTKTPQYVFRSSDSPIERYKGINFAEYLQIVFNL